MSDAVTPAANSAADKPPPQKKAYQRRRSGTASFHMSAKAVTLSIQEVYSWTPRQCLDYLIKARWGGRDTVVCPHCGTMGTHCWRGFDSRWKCSNCRSTFSVTSGTAFSHHKCSLQDILARALTFMNSAAGQPALQAKRHFRCSYNSAYVFQHKLREGFVRGFNVGLLSGEIEIDGAHQSGHRAAEKRGKPQATQGYAPDTSAEALTEAMLTTKGRAKGRKNAPEGAKDPQYGTRLPKDRRIAIALMQRSSQKGKGGFGTRVAVAVAENSTVVASVMKSFVAPAESVLNTDTSPAYKELGKLFLEHHTVEHAKMLVGPNGENNNQVESLNFRFDRSEQGIYLNIEPKYLLDYMCEAAFRSDSRRVPNGGQLQLALNCSMSVGRSLFWTGFTHGRHRKEELTHPLPRPAPSSGPRKGMNPNSQLNGRAPR